jgi:hypothetical protein
VHWYDLGENDSEWVDWLNSRHGLATTRDNDFLAGLSLGNQFAEMRFGLGNTVNVHDCLLMVMPMTILSVVMASGKRSLRQ